MLLKNFVLGGTRMVKYVPLILSFMLLFGCSANQDKKEEITRAKAANQSEIRENEANKTEYSKTEYSGNPQVTDDSSLQKAGDSFWDEKGKLILEDIKEVNKTYKIGPIELTILDVKVLHYLPAYNLIDFFHGFTHEAEEFDFIRVQMKIKNTTNEEVYFAPIALLETSSGEKMTWENDFYLEELNGMYSGSEEKIGNMGFPLNNHVHGQEDKAKSNHLEWIKLMTSEVLNKEHKEIAGKKIIEIKF